MTASGIRTSFNLPRRSPDGAKRNPGAIFLHAASSHCAAFLKAREGAAPLGELCEQRRGFELRVAGASGDLGESPADVRQPDAVGVVHRSARPYRPAVAIDPDHVDVARAHGDAFIENARALVDHREDQPLEYLLAVEVAALDAETHRGFDDQLLDIGIQKGRARAALVAVEAAPGLLAVAAGIDQSVGDLRLGTRGLTHAPTDVEPGEVAHGERPHGEAELGQR